MNENNRNYLAWCEEMRRRGDVARGLRFAVFVISTAILAGLVWLGIRAAAPAFCAYQDRVQAELDAEQEGLQSAYDAEAFDGLMRAAEQLREGDAE